MSLHQTQTGPHTAALPVHLLSLPQKKKKKQRKVTSLSPCSRRPSGPLLQLRVVVLQSICPYPLMLAPINKQDTPPSPRTVPALADSITKTLAILEAEPSCRGCTGMEGLITVSKISLLCFEMVPTSRVSPKLRKSQP